MRLKPLRDQVIVRKVEETMRGRFALPVAGLGSDTHVCGEVIAVGPGSRFADGTLLTPAVAVGDMVLYRKLAGEVLVLDDAQYVVLTEGDVLGILSAAPYVAVVRQVL